MPQARFREEEISTIKKEVKTNPVFMRNLEKLKTFYNDTNQNINNTDTFLTNFISNLEFREGIKTEISTSEKDNNQKTIILNAYVQVLFSISVEVESEKIINIFPDFNIDNISELIKNGIIIPPPDSISFFIKEQCKNVKGLNTPLSFSGGGSLQKWTAKELIDNFEVQYGNAWEKLENAQTIGEYKRALEKITNLLYGSSSVEEQYYEKQKGDLREKSTQEYHKIAPISTASDTTKYYRIDTLSGVLNIAKLTAKDEGDFYSDIGNKISCIPIIGLIGIPIQYVGVKMDGSVSDTEKIGIVISSIGGAINSAIPGIGKVISAGIGLIASTVCTEIEKNKEYEDVKNKDIKIF